MGDLDLDEFVCKLYVYLGAARKLFDDNGAIADELSEEFDEYKKMAYAKGFLMVASSPLTRSSYHASDDFKIMQENRKNKLYSIQ